MARTNKKGLDYFPLDVNFFEDDKIELINAEFGIKGEAIALRLLCSIYRNGYYYQWGEDESLLLAKRVGEGFSGAFVSEVVKGCVKRSFFDERVFNVFQILTSRGIQQRYLEAIGRRKSVDIWPEIMLINYNEYINGINVNINHLNADISTQSKKKVKESKKHSCTISFDSFWNLYEKKVGLREKVEKKWLALSEAERVKAMEHIPKYKQSQPNKKFRKDPLTYLNNKSFNDEIIFSEMELSDYDKIVLEKRRNFKPIPG